MTSSLLRPQVRGVRVQLRGKAHSEWRFVRGTARQIAKGDQQFIDDRRTLWGVDRRDPPRRVALLPRGEHRWAFSFRLPSSIPLPFSFDSRLCSIRYFVRATVELPPGGGLGPSALRHFSLLPAAAAPEVQERLRQPVAASTRRGLDTGAAACCPALPCFAPPLSLNVSLARSGYCSGEELRQCCAVHNGIERALRVRLQLVQLTEVVGAVGEVPASKQIERLACQWFSDAVKPRQVTDLGAWRRLRLPVLPPSLPGSLCDLLSVRYVLRLALCEVEAETLVPKQRPLQLELPLVVLGRPLTSGDTSETVALGPIVLRPCVANVEGGGASGVPGTAPAAVQGVGRPEVGVTDTTGRRRELVAGPVPGGPFQPVYPFIPDQAEARQLAASVKAPSTKKEKCTEKISTV